MLVEIFYLLELGITKILAKSAKEKEKEKERKKEREVAIYQKIVAQDALADQEGWKVYLFKGMHATMLTKFNLGNLVKR
jgi:hypothetical protein